MVGLTTSFFSYRIHPVKVSMHVCSTITPGSGSACAGRCVGWRDGDRQDDACTLCRCEVGCNEHIGGGGGQPHMHGDSFGPGCHYSAANSSSMSAHPPLVGLSFNGLSIYGRHLLTSIMGFTSLLDDFRGYAHDNLCYTQLLQLVTSGTDPRGVAAGLVSPASTVGPHKCWRANTTASPQFWWVFYDSDKVARPKRIVVDFITRHAETYFKCTHDVIICSSMQVSAGNTACQ